MPYRARYNPTNKTYTQPPLISVDVMRILDVVERAVTETLDQQVGIMFRMAQSKAPVRKMYKGGRATIRKLTAEELKQNRPAFLRTISNDSRNRVARAHPTLRSVTGSTDAYRYPGQSDRQVTVRNKETKWNDGFGRRIGWQPNPSPGQRAWKASSGSLYATLVEPNRIKLSLSRPVGKQLTGRARYDLQHAKVEQIKSERLEFRDVGRGALYWDTEKQAFFFGGNLRASVRVEARDREDFYERVVIAGGERAPYAKYLEFGTRKMAARPFMRPAFQHIKRTFRQRLLFSLTKVQNANPASRL